MCGICGIEADLALIESKLAEVMGSACDVACERVADIPREPSGKYLFTVCNVEATGVFRGLEREEEAPLIGAGRHERQGARQ